MFFSRGLKQMEVKASAASRLVHFKIAEVVDIATAAAEDGTLSPEAGSSGNASFSSSFFSVCFVALEMGQAQTHVPKWHLGKWNR